MTTITIAETDEQIRACFPVMLALREHLHDADSFLAQVRRQQAERYRLAFAADESGRPVAVAGFRTGECLAWSRFMYVDDLVTSPNARSRGHGATLLSFLAQLAEREGCEQLHLDSGTWRTDAHRFYEREGMSMTSLHFVTVLAAETA